MFSRVAFFCAAIALFAACGARAADRDVSGYDDTAARILLCSPSTSHFLIVYPSDKRANDKSFDKRQVLDLGALLKWQGDPATDLDPRRALSDVAKYSCGRFSLTFTAGFFNSNPNGELGAAEYFAVFSISVGAKTIDVQMSGECFPPGIGRAAYFLSNNASVIEGRYDASAKKHELVLLKTGCRADWTPYEKTEIQSLD